MIDRGFKGFRNEVERATEPRKPEAADRRLVLRALGGAFAWLLIGDGKATLAAATRNQAAPVRGELSGPDRQAARLGERFAIENPVEARQLLDEAIATLGGQPRATPIDGPKVARRLLLNPTRLAREFECGAAVTVEGWHLARSEAALCVYLHEIDRVG